MVVNIAKIKTVAIRPVISENSQTLLTGFQGVNLQFSMTKRLKI